MKRLVDNFNTMANGLEDAERELAASASAIAHELRTPVTILRARLQAILDGVFTPNAPEMRGLLDQVEVLSAIIEDMRVLSLAGARQLELRLERINLADEVDSFMASTTPMLAQSGINVETDFGAAIVSADPARVRQILNALLDNARRYAADGRSVRIETARIGGFGILRVLDRGPGLPQGAEENAFDRFWRAEPSRSRETGGTGLGLAVVAAIAQAHGGDARAFARDGGGAAFEIRLPALSQ